MTIGTKWIAQVGALAAARAALIVAAAEKELGAMLPDARIERGPDELRIKGRGLVRRWLADPALRFWAWGAK